MKKIHPFQRRSSVPPPVFHPGAPEPEESLKICLKIEILHFCSNPLGCSRPAVLSHSTRCVCLFSGTVFKYGFRSNLPVFVQGAVLSWKIASVPSENRLSLVEKFSTRYRLLTIVRSSIDQLSVSVGVGVGKFINDVRTSRRRKCFERIGKPRTRRRCPEMTESEWWRSTTASGSKCGNKLGNCVIYL